MKWGKVWVGVSAKSVFCVGDQSSKRIFLKSADLLWAPVSSPGRIHIDSELRDCPTIEISSPILVSAERNLLMSFFSESPRFVSGVVRDGCIVADSASLRATDSVGPGV
jgi:hypothetical protein